MQTVDSAKCNALAATPIPESTRLCTGTNACGYDYAASDWLAVFYFDSNTS